MGNNETKKTMRFWILSGIAAIVASQLPLLFKKKQQQGIDQSKQPEQQKKKPRWAMLLLGAILVGIILWLFDYFT